MTYFSVEVLLCYNQKFSQHFNIQLMHTTLKRRRVIKTF